LKILLLDTDPATGRAIDQELRDTIVRSAVGPAEGFKLLGGAHWDLILLDAAYCGAGIELLGRLRENGDTPIVLLSARPSMELTLDAIRLGARDVLPKPIPVTRLREILRSLQTERKVRPLSTTDVTDTGIIGASAEMLAVFKAIARAAASEATVLVLGESGSGKEMIARVLHAQSDRASGPFVAINCAAIPENLLESELFGHEKGAFTGAIGRRIGRFERANRGTLFLDEIGDMSLALQSKILRALQEREIERVGSEGVVPIDVRIIAATNRDLAEAVREERFREDLYYRLSVVNVKLPPLRERGSDLDLLTEFFASQYIRQHGRPIRCIAEVVFDTLRAYRWPGNVRQLRNVIERAVVMADSTVLLPEHLPPEILQGALDGADQMMEQEGELCTLEEMERRMIRRALRVAGNNHTLAAERLGIHRNTLRRKLIQYGMDAD
jgi:two-component system, NtrC family, response regulator AtoC